MGFNKWKEEQIKLDNLYYSKARRNKGHLVGKWKDRFNRKKNHSKADKIEFHLTFNDYLYKCYKANLNNPNQINTKGNWQEVYNLARYKDLGGYTLDNCRFITHEENFQEKYEHFNSTGVKPWKSPCTNKNSLEIWSQADLVYKWWVDIKVGRKKSF